MMWQMWTAFGIMLGNIMGVAFMNVGNDLNWRLMLGSTVVLPLIVCTQVYMCPESPRWLIQHDKIPKAYENFKILRPTEIQAAHDPKKSPCHSGNLDCDVHATVLWR
jgi:hypothetical protein